MKKFALAFIFGALTLMPIVAQAKCPTTWQKNHPWRTADNSRLRNQNRRINAGLKDGQLTKSEARALRQDDHQIRYEERAMASGNKGHHLTPAEQKALAQQLGSAHKTEKIVR